MGPMITGNKRVQMSCKNVFILKTASDILLRNDLWLCIGMNEQLWWTKSEQPGWTDQTLGLTHFVEQDFRPDPRAVWPLQR